jgi:hypothetical protein
VVDAVDYTGDPVAEAGTLTEQQLAALATPRDQELGDAEVLYEEAISLVEGMLDLAVATREGKQCRSEGCHTPAAFRIATAASSTQACREHLGSLVEGPCTITPLE